MKGLLRRIRHSVAARALVARAGAGYIRLTAATVRWQVIGAAQRELLQSGSGRHMLAIWHGRLLQIPTEMRPGVRVHAIISANRDGDIIAACVGQFGIETVRGSSRDRRKPGLDKGGREAAERGLELLRAHDDCIVALTPDGPRGPRMRCQRGVATLSALSGIPVTPWTFSTRRARMLRSWDRFLVPLPFDRGVMIYGDPIPAPETADDSAIEAHRIAIETALLALSARADRLCGRRPIAPADAPAYPGGAMAPAADPDAPLPGEAA